MTVTVSPHYRVVQDGRVVVVFRHFFNQPFLTNLAGVCAQFGLTIGAGPYETQQLKLDTVPPHWQTVGVCPNERRP